MNCISSFDNYSKWVFRNFAAIVAVSMYRDGLINKDQLQETLRKRKDWRNR